MKKITITNRKADFIKVEHFLENLDDEGRLKVDQYASVLYVLDGFFRFLGLNSDSNSVSIGYVPLDSGFLIELDLSNLEILSNERSNELVDFFNQMEQHKLCDGLEIDWNTLKFGVFFKDDSMPSQLAKGRIKVLMQYFEPKLERTLL